MSELALTDDEATALAGTTDSTTGGVYPSESENDWLAPRNRLDARLIEAARIANELRVYEVTGNADAVGVRAGRKRLGAATLVYAGADPAVDGLTDNDTTYIWLYSNAGTATIASAIDGTGWPAHPHWRLAEVTLASGVITGIVDRRGEGVLGTVLESYSSGTRPAASTAGRCIWNTTTSKPNFDTGAAWVLADGTAA